MVTDRRAFTLIEVLAVLLIVALAITLGMTSLRPQRRMATLQEVVAKLLDYDHSTRLYAERFACPLLLRINPTEVHQSTERTPDEDARLPLVLPSGFALRDLWIAGREIATNAQLELSIGSEGRSQTYGYRLETPGGKSRWIIMVGLTGQPMVCENEQLSKDILAALAQERPDTY